MNSSREVEHQRAVEEAVRRGSTAVPSWGLGPFTRPAQAGPVLVPQADSRFSCPMRGRQVSWEVLHTFNPAAVMHEGKVHLLYRAEDDSGSMEIGGHTSRLGLAVSADGVHFTRHAHPVLFPAADDQREREWDGGCEDPRCVQTEDGLYVLTYTQWNRRCPRLAIATSRNLITWYKHGPAFSGGYGDMPTKSGAMVCRLDGERLIAARIDGAYWMYWGEGIVHLARSADLLKWTPITAVDGGLLPMLAPRPGRFDSGLAEGGPPALLTDQGIVVLYNGRNAVDGSHDPRLAPGAYSAGQALFDATDPTRLISRTTEPFFVPQRDWEATGQYAAGTTFIEGLVRFQDRWLLYYGCADSRVGVAISASSCGLPADGAR